MSPYVVITAYNTKPGEREKMQSKLPELKELLDTFDGFISMDIYNVENENDKLTVIMQWESQNAAEVFLKQPLARKELVFTSIRENDAGDCFIQHLMK